MSRFVWPTAFVSTLLASTAILTAQRAPAPAQTGLPADILALACAPGLVTEEPAVPLRITGGQDSFTRRNYAPGDLVTINAGSTNGITVGQEFFVRRALKSHFTESSKQPINIRTAGWVRVYAVDDAMSLATVTYACDAIEVDDYLETFKLPERVVPNPDKPKPVRDNYARVLNGNDLRNQFGRGDFFTIARGSSEGITVGAQFVVYRDKKENNNFLFELGEAVAVSVGPQLSTLQVTLSRDAFAEGDYVAERKGTN
jgi:hypothetical protein